MQSVLQGRTQELQIHYNYTTYTVTLDVMDLAASKDMSIGTDLMRTLGIGYTGLAVSWTPPVKTGTLDFKPRLAIRLFFLPV
ncbi:hypothetical protein [Absidia glauca]|uniref:Uncharacterized protein n=1 Tax=Absidia glauca TaxID=4829 RepID=A0A168S275_ABSGL|nr:hypothetical protein [Absidia glauca]